MRKANGRRLIAFIMAFIMALSVVFQTDGAIRGFALVLAAQSGDGVATATDAKEWSGEAEASLAGDTIDLEDYECYISTRGRSVTYTGQPINIDTYVGVYKKTDINKTSPLSKTYYTISYENNTNVGTATVHIEGIESEGCTGSLSKTFVITQKSITQASLFYVDGKENINKLTVTANKNKYYTYQKGGVFPKLYVRYSSTGDFLTEKIDYDVTMYNNGSAGKLDKLNGPVAQIRSKDNGNYDISYDFYFGINAADIADQTISIPSSVKYTGTARTPSVVIYDIQNGKVLTRGTDYTLDYSNNVEPGEAKVTITGDGEHYTGEIVKTFTILSAGDTSVDIEDTTVSVDASDLVYDGNAKTPGLTVKYGSTVLTEGTDYEILSYNNNVNVSDNTKASVTIAGIGGYTGSKTVEFEITPRNLNADYIEVSVSDVQYLTRNGSDVAVWPSAITVKDTGLDVALTVGADCTVDKSGYLSKKQYPVGKYSFNLKGYGNYTGTKKVEFNILPGSIADAVITVDKVAYTGSPVTPKPASVKINGTSLTEGVDYEIKDYSNNVNLGSSAKIVLEGKGNFTGTVTGTFTIYTDKININTVDIADLGDIIYEARQIKPDPELTYNGKTLVKGVDYSVSYGTNLNTSEKGSVTFTGMGDYAGEVTKTFTINKKSLGADDVILTVNKNEYEYTGEEIKPDITVTYNDYTLVEGTDYTFSNLKSATGTYTIYIVGGSSNNFSGIKQFTMVITSPAGDMADLEYGDIEDQYYTGEEIKPVLSIKNGVYSLKENTDYKVVERTDNINVGRSTIVIEGINPYSGTKVLTFNILAKPLEDCDISDIADVTYDTDGEVKPTVVVKNNGKQVDLAANFKVEYKNNTAVTDEAEVTITAANDNYTGSVTKYFRILPINIIATNVSITDVSDSKEYTGHEITPAVEIKRLNKGKIYVLKQDEDYTVDYSGNTEVTGSGDKALVVVKGINNFTGEKTMKFTIEKRKLSSCIIDDVADQLWTGNAITPDVQICNGDIKLVKDQDYTLSYTDNTDVGIATVVITGAGDNYTGEVTKKFNISKEFIDITDSDKVSIAGLKDQVYNFGSPLTPSFTLSYDGSEMTAGVDYTYKYTDNVYAGTATLTVEGSGKYKGTKTYTFTISKFDVSDGELLLPYTTTEYTGSRVEPVPSAIMIDGVKRITTFGEFDITYSSNTNVGQASVTVAAKQLGNYTGFCKTTFQITKKSIAGAEVKASDVAYNGKAQTPAVTVVCSDGHEVPSDSYSVEYKDNTNVGTATVTVTALADSNYTGTAQGSFEINGVDINAADIADIPDQTYTGTAIIPSLTVTHGESVLTEKTDYVIQSATDNINVSTSSVRASVTIRGAGVYSGTKTVYFNIVPRSIEDAEVTGIQESAAYTGTGIVFDNVAVSVGGTVLTADDYTITYTDNVNVTGDNKAAVVTITGKGNYTGSITKEFKITPKKIGDCDIDDIPGQIWTGKAITPKVAIRNGQTMLSETTDYTVKYSNNTDETDKAQAVITGTGNYTGSVTVYFSITREIVDISDAVISAIPAQTYALGKEITPSVTVVYDGVTLTENVDYTLSYEDNINVGTAYVTVTGKKYYSNTKKASFIINPLDVSDGQAVFVSDSFVYTGKAQQPKVGSIKLGNVSVTDMDSFDVSYSGNVNAGTATATVTAKAGGNYKGSVKAEFTISAADITAAAAEVADVVYQGTPQKPAVKVTYNGVTLTEGKDYTVSYENNTEVGKGTAKITGAGNYTGEIISEFTISACDMTDADVEADGQIYTGKALTPEVVVTLGGRTLTAGTDYTVEYDNNVNVGTARVIVSGNGNYTGTAAGTFKISAANISGAKIWEIADQIYTGKEITPDVTVSWGDVVLKAGEDYDLTYAGNINASSDETSAQVIITGKGNYTGTAKTGFAIVPKTLAAATVSGYEESVAYTGADVVFTGVIVTDGEDVLTEGIDYKVTYTGNKSVTTDDGTYFNVTGTGNYTGTKIVHFVITAKDLADCDVQEIESQIWTGKAIEPDVTIRNSTNLLVKGVDYDVAYESNINETTASSKAKAIITGKGNYTGEVIREFAIGRVFIDISKAEVEAIPYQTYAFGKALTPDVKVSLDGKQLKKNTDYILDYTDNVNAGTATVKITGTGNYNKFIETTFVIKPADISKAAITLRETELPYTGEAVTPSVTKLSVQSGDAVESITDLTSFVIKYSDNINAGTAKVTVTAGAAGNFTGTAEGSFTITKLDIKNAIVNVADVEYTGTAVIPDVKVTLGGRELTEETDYRVEADNNVNAGSDAQLSIIGTGNYQGSLTLNFEIRAKSIESGKCSIAAQVYTGSAIIPGTVLEVAGKILTEGTDYTVTCTDNIDVTTDEKKATAVLKGKGNYTGKLIVTFDITPKTLGDANVDDIDSQEYTGQDIEPAVVVRDGEKVLVAGRDYEVSYSNNVDKTTEAMAVVKGNGNYQGTVIKLFEICGASISPATVTGVAESAEYTGDAITFDDITVVKDDKTLVYGTDYTVSYENNINVTGDGNKAYVVIKGMNNYGGQIKVAFSIIPRSMDKCKINAIGGQIYTGKAVTPEVTVRDGSRVLEAGKDYTVAYRDNVEVGKNAKAIVTGMGNYTGELIAEFTIAKEVIDISDAVIGSIADQYYNFGDELTPDVVVALGDRKLTENVDYSVTYTNNIEAGTATVLVKGIDQNKGELSATFRILPIDISDAELELAASSYEYTGDAVKAGVKSLTVLRNGTKKSITALDKFDVTYTDNENVGTATIQIKAGEVQSFTGSVSAQYTITAASIAEAEVSVDSPVYTGSAVIPVCRVVLNGRTLAEGTDYKITATDNVNVTDPAKLTIEGTGNYTGKLSQSFSITAKKITQAVVTADPAEYTGKPVTTTVKVVLDGQVLSQGTDYTVSYSDNLRVTSGSARAVATITGKGNYTGEIHGEFEITPMDISKLDIADIPDQVYGGQPVKPEIRIANGKNVLAEGTDYTVEYSDNDAVTDEAKAVITGCGNYKGSVQKSFVISAYSITSAQVSGIPDTVVFTGDSIEFTGIKVTVDGQTLVNGTDYTITYENNVNVTDGGAYVIISGIGNYGGQIKTAFSITARNLSRCSIDPIGGQIHTGAAVKPDVTVRDGARVLEAGKDYDVVYNNNVEESDNAEVTVTGKGNYKGSISAVFTIAKEIVDISKAVMSTVQDQYYDFGNAIRPDVTLTYNGKELTRDVDYELVYINNFNEGTATIKANGINKNTGSVSETFAILPIDITDAEAALAQDVYEYTGSAVCPAVTMITVKRNGAAAAVTSMDAFEISYKDNVDVGTAVVEITAVSGHGFTGKFSKEFTISGVDITDAAIDVSPCEYTGLALTPDCSVTMNGRKLKSGADYKVSYSNNVNVGTKAMVTVTGTGNYKGTIVGYFEITARDLGKAEIGVASVVYTGKALTPDAVVTLDGEILNAGIDYEISYSNNINVTTAKSKAAVTIKGIGNYRGAVSGTFDITAKDISGAVISDISDQKYDGSEIRPNVSVTLGGEKLTVGTDYTVIYENNIEASDEARVIVAGKGNYSGTVEKTFVIKSVTLADAEVTGIPDRVVYTGKAITVGSIQVVLDDRKLSEDVDYTIAYENNINVTDSAKIRITGAGNYSGEISRIFSITAKSISGCSVDSVGGQLYTGKEIKPEVTVRDGSNILKAGTDYTVGYRNNVNVTTEDSPAEIKITGCGNYTGETVVSFAISKKLADISKAVISSIGDQLYNFGQPLTPEVTVTLAGKTLANGVDYALVYVDNTDEGTATVTAKGINSNTGSVSAKFKIKPVDISDGQLVLNADSYPYTGTAVKPQISSFTVKRAGVSVAVDNFDNLEIQYSDNVNVGTGKVTISALPGEGFTGSVSRTFTIVGTSVSNSVVRVDNGVYTGEAVMPEHTVTLGGRSLVEGTDYRADFSNNVNVTDGAVLTITGMGNYSGSTTARFKISPRKLTDADITVAPARYTGKALTPAVMVVLGGVTLVEDVDYTVDYSDNVNVTTDTEKASVTITGTGNYTGTAVEEFDITARDISLAEIKSIDAQSYTGNPVTPKLTVTDGQNELVEGRDYTVSYRNNTSVTTSAVVEVTGKGNYTGTASRTFVIGGADIADAEITGIRESVPYTGREITFAGLKVMYGDELLVNGRDYTVSYSGNKNVTDNAEIRITGAGNYVGSVIRYFAITRRSIDDCHVSEIPGQIYTGKVIEPEISVSYGDITLVEDVDYEITYSNNIEATGSGEPAKATITGKGSFTGTVYREFTITKDPINISGAKITAIADQEFAKKNITPAVNVTYGGRTLVEGTDYKVSYSNNYNVGTATVTITGYGSFVSSKTTTFVITRRNVSGYVMDLMKKSLTYTGKALTPAAAGIQSTDGTFVLDDDEIADFIVRYTANVNVGTATVTATAGSQSNYTGSVSAEFSIVPKALDGATAVAEATEYTGDEVTPVVMVTSDGVVLSADDYTVSYENNIEVGTAGIKVTGKGNYTGIITGSFEITARSIKNCSVVCSASAEYNGGQIVPVVTVKNGDRVLTEDVDYVLSYDMNTDATARAKVVVTGKGNYKDSVTRYFAITRKSIADADVAGITAKSFTGNPITQDMTVKVDGVILTQGTDYTVKYENNIHAGTAAITITGAGNYTDSVKKSFVINRVDISDTAVITGTENEVTYKGKAFKFDNVKVTWGRLVLQEGRDYSMTYQNNSGITMTRTSKASWTMKFYGDYKGSITKQFRIKAFDISNATVTGVKDKAYTGSAITQTFSVKIGNTVINPKEYSVKYTNNIKPGVAKITITGTNNFYGTKSVTFNIRPAKVKGLKASGETTKSLKLTWTKDKLVRGYRIYRYDTGKKNYVLVKTLTDTSYTLTGLSAGADYRYAVSSYVKTADGKLIFSDKTIVDTFTVPAKVKGLTYSTRSDKNITLKWNSVNGATGYSVYRKVSGKYKLVKNVTGTSYNITGLKAVTTYNFKVVAYKKRGSKKLTGAETTANIMTTPSAVKNLKVTARSSGSITLAWDKVSNADGYMVYRYSGKNAKLIKVISSMSRSRVVFVSSGLKGGTTYTYKVVAYKSVRGSRVQNPGTKITAVTTPATPLVTVSAQKGQATISWRKASGAGGYIVYMSTSQKGRYSRVATINNGSTTKYVKKNLKKGKTYYFKVVSYKKLGGKTYMSQYSTVKKITVK